MDFIEFKEKIIKNLGEYFGEDVNIRSVDVKKNNGIVLSGISVFRGKSGISPTLYLEEFFERYSCGEVYAQIIHDIITIFEDKACLSEIDMSFFADFECVSNQLVFKVINAEKNKELLSDVPYVPFHDLAIVFMYTINSGELMEKIGMGDGCGGSILIHNSHLEMWGITIEELKRVATDNTPKQYPSVITRMSELIGDIMAQRCAGMSDADYSELMDAAKMDDLQMYVASNSEKQYGAAIICYDGELKRISHYIGESYYIIPSSVHEIIILPESAVPDEKVLKDMVISVNQNVLNPMEVLSDNIYFYDEKTGELAIV